MSTRTIRWPGALLGSVLAVGLAIAPATAVTSASGPADPRTPPMQAGTSASADELVIIPLDDRPANLYFPQMTAASAGVQTLFPPEDLVGTFTTPGDGDALGDWLLEQDDADGYIVSASMLAYGGLIASRTGTAATIEEARARVAVLNHLRERNPDTPIYVYDTIQRLALSALGENAELYYTLLREWAILVDRVENLGQEQYREELEEVRAQIPNDILADYLQARERNHEINRLLVEWAADGVVDHLVLAQDDADPYGLHRAEREDLTDLVHELGAEDVVQIFPGADEVDATLVSRFVQERNGTSPEVSVEYSGIDGSQWTAPFEDTTYDENIARHLVAAGASLAQNDPDIHLLVNTPSASDGQRETDLDDFVDRIATLQDAGEEVVIVDAVEVNRADHALIERLAERVDLPDLLSYSGWNTAGNALGIATGHGFSRWSYLQTSGSGFGVPAALGPAQTHVSYLLHRFVLDDRFKNQVQPDAYDEAEARGWNVFGLTEEQTAIMQDYVADRLTPIAEEFHAEYFAGHEVDLAQRGARMHTATIGPEVSVHVALPWPRLFETGLEPEVQLQRT